MLVNGERDRPLVRGGRRGLHPSPRSLRQGGRPGELPTRQGQRQRRGRGGDGPPTHSLRDRIAASLLHRTRRRAQGCAPREREDHPVSLQGRRFVLLGRAWWGARRGSRLALSGANRRDKRDQGPPLLLQREGGPRSRRRGAGAAPDAVVLDSTGSPGGEAF